MSNQLATRDETGIIESVVIGGDLKSLTPEQRVNYYQAVCKSLGLNPLTRPFDYITLNGKLTLYARKDCAEQLRKINNISINEPKITFEDDWIIVTVSGTDKTGRADSDIGVVNRKDMQGNFGNALMKAVTKAKRRLTLSISGLGMLDETEIETIPTARPVVVVQETGEIVQTPPAIPFMAGEPEPARQPVIVDPDSQPPSDKAWIAWDKLRDQASKFGILAHQVPSNTNTGELRAAYAELLEIVKNAKAQAETAK